MRWGHGTPKATEGQPHKRRWSWLGVTDTKGPRYPLGYVTPAPIRFE